MDHSDLRSLWGIESICSQDTLGRPADQFLSLVPTRINLGLLTLMGALQTMKLVRMKQRKDGEGTQPASRRLQPKYREVQ